MAMEVHADLSTHWLRVLPMGLICGQGIPNVMGSSKRLIPLRPSTRSRRDGEDSAMFEMHTFGFKRDRHLHYNAS